MRGSWGRTREGLAEFACIAAIAARVSVRGAVGTDGAVIETAFQMIDARFNFWQSSWIGSQVGETSASSKLDM